MMKPEELGKRFWFPGLLQHQDLGQLQVHHCSQSPSLNFTLYFIFSKGLQSPLRVLSEGDKGRFQDKLGDLWR